MIAGCYISSQGKYKVGAKFVAYKTRLQSEEESYGWYSYELGGWLEGEIASDSQRQVENGESVYSDSSLETEVDVVSGPVSFCVCSVNYIGNGNCSILTDLFGGKFAANGTSVTFSAIADSGHKILSFSMNGDESTSERTFTADDDLSAFVRFCPESYTVRDDGVLGSGTHAVRVNGSVVTTTAEAVAGDIIGVDASAMPGSAFLYTEIDGVRYVENPLSLTVQDRVHDNVFNVKSVFGNVASVSDSIVIDGSGLVVVKSGESVVKTGAGEFVASVGLVYLVFATPDVGKRVVGFYENGRLVSSGDTYTFVQDSASRTISVVFGDEERISVSLFSGQSIDARTEEWNGCTCDVVTPTGTTVGTYVFSPQPADGYHFVRLYVEDLDGTGRGTVIPAGSSYSIKIGFNARVVAIFGADDSPFVPLDEDQGNASHTSATVKVWEGSQSRMVATWRSRRYVFAKPVPMSSGRVYASGYSESSPVIKVSSYESPSVSDGNEILRTVRNQNAFRLPTRRPEKYLEVEVSSDSTVLEVAISTSMEGLWQTNT